MRKLLMWFAIAFVLGGLVGWGAREVTLGKVNSLSGAPTVGVGGPGDLVNPSPTPTLRLVPDSIASPTPTTMVPAPTPQVSTMPAPMPRRIIY